MELRKHVRVPVEYLASFSGTSSRAQGVILDLSIDGCRARSDYGVKKDDCLGVLIDVPEYENPLYVSRAAIRWTKVHEFGMEFIQMELSDRQRLVQVVQQKIAGSM
jgi:hypothetical protein